LLNLLSFLKFSVLEFELRALCLLSKSSTTCAAPSALFALVVLDRASCFDGTSLWLWSFYLYFPSVWGHLCHHCPLCWLRWTLSNFLLRLVLPISACWVAGITGMYHHVGLSLLSFSLHTFIYQYETWKLSFPLKNR
jgi:hypothetical protein